MRAMIEQINNTGGYNGKLIKLGDFTQIQLESILEFGDHRCFPETKYVQSTGYYYDKNGRNQKTHYSLPDPASRTFNDINISKKLGGYRMRKSILRTIDSKETKLNKKRAYIKQVLSTLPEKFKVIGDIIKTDDLSKFAEFSFDIYKNRMFRYIVMLVIIRAEENGLVFSENELFNHFDMKRKGMVAIKSDLTQAGFRSKIVRDKKIENALIEASNLLFELNKTEFIDSRQMKMVRSIINTFPDKFPKLFHARSSLGLPMIFMSLYIMEWNEQLTIGKVVRKYSQHFDLPKDEYYTLYQSTKRACKRADQLDRMELNVNQFLSFKNLHNPCINSDPIINNQLTVSDNYVVNEQAVNQVYQNNRQPPEEVVRLSVNSATVKTTDNIIYEKNIVSDENVVSYENNSLNSTISDQSTNLAIISDAHPDRSEPEKLICISDMVVDASINLSLFSCTQYIDIINYKENPYQIDRQEEWSPLWMQDIHYPDKPPPWLVSALVI